MLSSLSNIERKDLFETANKEMKNVFACCSMNLLSLIADTANHTYFSISKETKENTPLRMRDLNINNIFLKRVNKLTFLGGYLNKTRNWQSHIALILNKVSKNIGLLFKASLILSKKHLCSFTFPTFVPTLMMEILYVLPPVKLRRSCKTIVSRIKYS